MFYRSEFRIFYRKLWLQASRYIILYFCKSWFLLWMSIYIYIHLLSFQGWGLTNLDVLFSCRYLISSLLDSIYLSFILVIHFFIIFSTFYFSDSLSIFGNLNLSGGIPSVFLFDLLGRWVLTSSSSHSSSSFSSSLTASSSFSWSSSFCSAPATYFFKISCWSMYTLGLFT